MNKIKKFIHKMALSKTVDHIGEKVNSLQCWYVPRRKDSLVLRKVLDIVVKGQQRKNMPKNYGTYKFKTVLQSSGFTV